MPLYPYECDACGHALEVFQNIEDRKLRKCPACAKPKLSRRISAISAGQVYVSPDLGHRMIHYPRAGSSKMAGLPEPPHRDANGYAVCRNETDIRRHERNMAASGHPTHYERPSFGRGKKTT